MVFCRFYDKSKAEEVKKNSMKLKDFAEQAGITCEEAKAIMEKVFGSAPLGNNYVLTDEEAEKIRQEFIGSKKRTKKTLREIHTEENSPIVQDSINTHNAEIVSRLIEDKFDIFVDTNFIFSSYFPAFVEGIEYTLRSGGTQIIVIEDVVNEVKKFIHDRKQYKLNGLAKKRMELLEKCINNGLFRLQKEPEIKKLCGKYGFADFTFHIILLLHRLKGQNAILLTNEKNLGIGNLMINHDNFIRSESEIRVARIREEDGQLVMRKLQWKNCK